MRDAIWLPCHGEAHENAYIDYCMCCMPYWGVFPVCPDCSAKLVRQASGTNRERARCTNSACASWRRWFATKHEPNGDRWGRFALLWSEIAFCFARGIS